MGLPSTTAQVVFAQFVQQAQAPLFAVKYKASGQSMTDVLGGQIPLVIDTVTASRAHIASGKLRDAYAKAGDAAKAKAAYTTYLELGASQPVPERLLGQEPSGAK